MLFLYYQQSKAEDFSFIRTKAMLTAITVNIMERPLYILCLLYSHDIVELSGLPLA